MYSFYNQILSPICRSIKNNNGSNAFCIKNKFYTYEDFGKAVSKISIELVKYNLKEKQVGLVINDDLETYASIIALWMQGYCYVPLHPNWPIERCLKIINQVNINLIIDTSKKCRYNNVSVINPKDLQFSDLSLIPVEDVSEEELAYILFTSGSTGKPKGVQLMRKNVASFLDSFWDTGIDISSDDRCLQCFDLTFDVSVQCYLIALTRGACVYTVPIGQIKYVYVSQLIDEQKLTFAAMAPSMLRYLEPYFDELDATSLKNCILTAEACPINLIEKWYKCAAKTEVYDFYGPTEATIYCTYYKLSRRGNNKSLNGVVSIGKPMKNVIGLILDEDGNVLSSGEKGELCVAGDQVTCGYWKNKEKNESSFFLKEMGGKLIRFYHTGDLCYKDSDGDIMYSGRLDHQAKIQGFRVEMGEIEYHAKEFLKGPNVVCLAFDNNEGLTEIAMFIEGNPMPTDRLVSYMRSKMPNYMIPGRFIFVPSFPLNSNEKIDKVKLKQLI